MSSFFSDFSKFLSLWWHFLSHRLQRGFFGFEAVKGGLAVLLYKQRGKFARPFVHSGMVAMTAMGVMLTPIISEEFPGKEDSWRDFAAPAVLSATTENPDLTTQASDKVRDKIYPYTVQEGETLSTIAEKFGISSETIAWQNDVDPKKPKIKAGQTLEILPVSGVVHKVKKGETIYSIAKDHKTDAQAIVDFPFNTFVNDETFALAVGQEIIVPDGVPVEVAQPAPTQFARRSTPDAGTVTASGSFVWPASGDISQHFRWYHRAIDIANRAAPEILAADSGTVVVAGWPDNSGYGNRVIIDHGNGFQTLYAHLSSVYVNSGQTVRRGSAIGKMGSTGRSTGIHLHFEVRQGGGLRNPLEVLN